LGFLQELKRALVDCEALAATTTARAEQKIKLTPVKIALRMSKRPRFHLCLLVACSSSTATRDSAQCVGRMSMLGTDRG
jgi:hypothetical protein